MSKTSSKIHYVDNKKLNEAMIAFVDKCKVAEECGEPRPKIPEYIGECVYKIATRLATNRNFSSYTYKDEMIADGIEVCIRYMHNFNPEKSKNPFAYFTQIIYFAFLQRIQKEKKQAYIKAKSFENSAIMNTLVDDANSPYFTAIQQNYVIDGEKMAAMEESFKPANKRKKNK